MTWTFVSASCRGTSHESSNSRLQDASSAFLTGLGARTVFTAIVSDGAGSAVYGGQGASLTCRSVAVSVRNHFGAQESFPDDKVIQGWLDSARDQLIVAADRRQVALREFSATLLLLITDGNQSLTMHIGDGCAVVRRLHSHTWEVCNWPFHGQYASTTSFITDEPSPTPAIVRSNDAINAVVMFSDGLERLALDFSARAPFPGFLDPITAAVERSNAVGKDHALAIQLRRFLNSADVNSRTDDDKTLIIAVRR